MSFLTLTLGILGVWRVTHLLHAEEGPWRASARLRLRLGTGGIGRAMECFDCLSLWIAAPFALLVGTTWPQRALSWPALSAGAIVINRVVSSCGPPPVATYVEDPPEEVTDVPVRTAAVRYVDPD